MRSHFIARCMSLCFACMIALQVSGAILFLGQPLTAYASSTACIQNCTVVTAFEIRRPDPNNPYNPTHITVLSVKLRYSLMYEGVIITNKAYGCLKTPGNEFYTLTGLGPFAWETTVYLDVYKSSDCKGPNVNGSFIAPWLAFKGFVPAKGQVVKQTCWVDLNALPNGKGGGCNDGSPHP